LGEAVGFGQSPFHYDFLALPFFEVEVGFGAFFDQHFVVFTLLGSMALGLGLIAI
jgi:hypothetical protein